MTLDEAIARLSSDEAGWRAEVTAVSRQLNDAFYAVERRRLRRDIEEAQLSAEAIRIVLAKLAGSS